jgi:hypothetical protein
LFDDADERTHTDAREKDDHLVLIAVERIGEGKRFGIRFERNFTQRGRDHRVAVEVLDERGNLRRAPALERQDAAPFETWCSHPETVAGSGRLETQ